MPCSESCPHSKGTQAQEGTNAHGTSETQGGAFYSNSSFNQSAII